MKTQTYNFRVCRYLSRICGVSSILMWCFFYTDGDKTFPAVRLYLAIPFESAPKDNFVRTVVTWEIDSLYIRTNECSSSLTKRSGILAGKKKKTQNWFYENDEVIQKNLSSQRWFWNCQQARSVWNAWVSQEFKVIFTSNYQENFQRSHHHSFDPFKFQANHKEDTSSVAKVTCRLHLTRTRHTLDCSGRLAWAFLTCEPSIGSTPGAQSTPNPVGNWEGENQKVVSGCFLYHITGKCNHAVAPATHWHETHFWNKAANG